MATKQVLIVVAHVWDVQLPQHASDEPIVIGALVEMNNALVSIVKTSSSVICLLIFSDTRNMFRRSTRRR